VAFVQKTASPRATIAHASPSRKFIRTMGRSPLVDGPPEYRCRYYTRKKLTAEYKSRNAGIGDGMRTAIDALFAVIGTKIETP